MRRIRTGVVGCVLTLPLVLPAQRPVPDTIVRVATAPRHAGVATLVPDLRIEDGADPDGFHFGMISGIAVGPSGALYVHDQVTPTLRMYDARGRFVRTIGRKGGGPGEYQRISGVTTLADGRVLLLDTGNWRINVYGAEGAPLIHWSVPNRGGDAQMVGRHTLTATRDGVVSLMYTDRSFRYGWIRLRADGSVLDTVLVPSREELGLPALEPSRVFRASTSDDRYSVSAQSPSTVSAQWVQLPSGVVLHTPGSRYQVDVSRPGARVVSIRRDIRGAPFTAAERRLAEREITALMRIVDPGWRWNDALLAANRPPLVRAELAEDGRVWVLQRHAGVMLGGGGSGGSGPNASGLAKRLTDARQAWCRHAGDALYDVYEADGVFVGTVRVPPCLTLWRIDGDVLWGAGTDPDDVVTLQRYRVHWGGARP